jgi:PAS domain S-box-containing protein
VNVEQFAKRIQLIHWRLAELYQDANGSIPQQRDLLLPTAFKELGTASEELQVAVEELYQQSEELAATRLLIEAERQRYQELFEFMPNPYFITDAQGKIKEINRAAARLLNLEQLYLQDKLLINFIPLQDRPAFRFKLNQLQQRHWIQNWTVHLQPRNSECLEVELAVNTVCNEEGELLYMRWIVRDITQQKQELKTLQGNNYDIIQDRPLHTFSKGEIIPLSPTCIWLVSQGVVKLNTLSETGDEILMGLVAPSMPFGSGMTSLPTYQAIALSETVKLVSFSPAEISGCPYLSQMLLPQFNQRLRQTELLLAIAGKRQVRDRLYHLLQLLKQEIGVPVAQGTRLTVRLTHQDLADACCTTRVTITRLLGQLHKQGKIMFDSKHHLIIRDY